MRYVDLVVQENKADINRLSITIVQKSGYIVIDNVATKFTVKTDETLVVWRDTVERIPPYSNYKKCLSVIRKVIKLAKQAEVERKQSKLF